MMDTLLKAKTGVNVPDHKTMTNQRAIEPGPVPEQVVFPMRMHAGAPAEPVVAPGDKVRIGTRIGRSGQTISAHIHSSVSGRVTALEERESLRGTSLCVVVDNDGQDLSETMTPLGDDLSQEAFLERVSLAGITGKGGAGFPTHVKMKPKESGHQFLLINGAECEPYSTTDHRVMVEYPEQILRTVQLMHRVFGIGQTLIGIEENKPDAVAIFQKALRDRQLAHIGVRQVETRYPQGHQGLLIRKVLDREVPAEVRAGDVGILAVNISTVKAIHDAVFGGRPLTERVVTVTGPVLREPRNLMSRIGTPVREMIEHCGGFSGTVGKMISGGPMMGKAFQDLSIPIAKDTTTLLFLPPDPETDRPEADCIRCARCVDGCPIRLQPILIRNAYQANRLDLCEKLKTTSCIQCGCCTYVCPSRIRLLENIQRAMTALREKG